MRVLVIDEELPSPPDTGKRIRTLSLLSRLAGQVEITLLAPGDPAGEQEAVDALVKAGIRVILVPLPAAHAGGGDRRRDRMRFAAHLVRNLGERYPYSVVRHFSREMEHAVLRAWGSGEYDLLHCEWTPFASYLRCLEGAPAVIMCHNVESEIWRRQARFGGNLSARVYSFFQWRKMDHFEQQAFRVFGPAIAVSDRDARLLRTRYGATVLGTVENGVDTNYFTPRPGGERLGELVFVGSMDWRPNQDAVRFLLDEIWPTLTRHVPGIHLTLVGRRPPRWIIERCAREDGVECTGTVADVRPYMERASVIVVPLRIGGGSRIKILEAMSAGKAVVSTTVGAEGLDLTPGRHLLVADRPREFAAAVRDLLASREERERLGRGGRALAQRRYGWDEMARRLRLVWEEAARGGGRGRCAGRRITGPEGERSARAEETAVDRERPELKGEERVHVLHLRASEFVGGPEKLIFGQCDDGASGRFRYTLASFTKPGDGNGSGLLHAAAERGLRTAALGTRGPFDPAVVGRLAQLIRETNVDIVSAHGYRARLVAYAAKLLTGTPVVAVCHGWTGEDRKVRLYEAVDRRVLRAADHVIAVSQSMRLKVLRLGIEEGRVTVVPNSIERLGRPPVPAAVRRPDGLRAELGIERRAPLIVSAGRLSPEKGHRFLVSAAPFISTSAPEAHIVILGEGPERSSLIDLARRLAVADRVLFPGFRSDLALLWAEFDLFVLPSLSEGLPLVVLEAMAAGVPCVATRVGGVPEVIRHRETGVLVPPGSPQALGRAIVELVSDSGLRARVGASGRRFVAARHTWARNRRTVEQVYGEVLAHRR